MTHFLHGMAISSCRELSDTKTVHKMTSPFNQELAAVQVAPRPEDTTWGGGSANALQLCCGADLACSMLSSCRSLHLETLITFEKTDEC